MKFYYEIWDRFYFCWLYDGIYKFKWLMYVLIVEERVNCLEWSELCDLIWGCNRYFLCVIKD